MIRDGLPKGLNDKADELIEIPREFLKSTSGIYFLCLDNKIQYIGQSVHVVSRVADHVRKRDQQDHWNGKPKEFTHVYYIEVPEDKLDEMEQFYIHKHQPPLNKKLLKGPRQIPVTIRRRIKGLKENFNASEIQRILKGTYSLEEIEAVV